MSFAEDLWDGFSTVGKWEQQGTAMCKAVCRFYRKRAKIEETYGKSLCKLVQQITDEIQQPGSSYCNDTICYGTLGSGWIATCHNTQVQAELHLNFADQIRKNIVENLQVNTLQLEDQLKQIMKDGERLLVDQDQWLATLKKTKQAYHKAVKEAEAAKSVLDETIESKSFSSKAEKRVTKATQEVQSAEQAYHAQIKHANIFTVSFHSELMPRVMKRLEDIGRSRQQLLLHHFKELSRISQEIPNGINSAGNALAKAINMVDVQKDVQDFIKFNKTNQQRPPAFQFEPPSEDLSAPLDVTKKGKHFFTLARKNKSSPNSLSKGNPGSPPSLSPATSGLIIREKAFKFSVFGSTLDEIMTCQREILPDCDIPYFLLVLTLDILRANAFCLEGVFRVPAPTHETETLARQFDAGNYDLSSVQSPYTTTHLIKKWCRDLPDPLIPSYLYERCIACNTREEARDILPMIPPLFYKVVQFLIQLLHEFSLPSYSEQSKMTSANFAMVFTPSFLRCASTDMADFLLNVHREKNFVQLLIEGVEERITPENIERMMAPLDDIIFTKDNPKWHLTKREITVPPLQLSNLSGEMYNSELKSELQRQASEREMILVKQQQLRKLTARDDLSDPKVLHARLMDERAEKEKFQDSLMLKDKTIQVMRTELSHTLQEKLQLENAVKSLQHRIEKLEIQLGPEESLNATDAAALANLSSWRINVRENIQNYELKTRAFRSGSFDTGLERLKNSRASAAWHKIHRSLSPLSPKGENRNTIHLGDLFNFRVDPAVLTPFKLPNSAPVSTPEANTTRLPPVFEDSPSPRVISPTPAIGRRNTSSAPNSPRRERGSPEKEYPAPALVPPRRDTISSPRGVSFRDLSTVHVYQQDTPATQDIITTSALVPAPSVDIIPAPVDQSPRADFNSPRIPRLKMNIINSGSEAVSPRSRHTLHVASSARSTSPTLNITNQELSSPRNPRHSTPVTGAGPPETTSPRMLGISSKNAKSESEHPSIIGRTASFGSSGGKRKNTLNNSTPVSSSKKDEKKLSSNSSPDKRHKQMTSSLDDQRIFDLINTNVQKYEISKKEPTPASPKSLSSSFPFKLRLLIQKSKSTAEQAVSSPALSYEPTNKKSKEPPIPEEPHKSPRSPKNSPRPQSPRNRPHSRQAVPLGMVKNSSPAASPPLSPRAAFSSSPPSDDFDSSAYASPRKSHRTLSFPTPRAHPNSGSSLSLANSPPRAPMLSQSPRPTRSQTFLASGAAGAQELHNLALEIDKMKKEVHKRLCACVELIGNTPDYAQTIEISKSIRLLIKCLDLALSKLGLDERQMRQLGTGKSSLPEMKSLASDDSRLRKLREVLVISLDRIVDQMRCLGNIASQITMLDDVYIITQTLSELSLFFSKQDQTISKIGPQEMVEGIRRKIDDLKTTWNDLPLDRQVEIAKVIIDLKKDIDEFCADNNLHAELERVGLTSTSGNDTQSERITKTIFSTLDRIYVLCVTILQSVKHRSLRQSDTAEDVSYTEKLLEIFKSLSTK